ncbi:MAG TPA: D-glycero-beta-D-manno-heptose 1,7-bisphosphate 7-phosphatase [Usitatibacteraceae bacterium]|nr:D-glycero-beta-D-manno-heptose 1,7-bisphosphate 7-phosphatase [Usitatibacteraceae bacterium]
MNPERKLVILDRDGVINVDSANFIKSPDEWKPIPGSIEAIARLNQNGYRVVVATNQSGIGRGLFDMATLNAINDKMTEMVFRQGGHIDAVFFCPCTAEQQCHCRKPDTGMFEDIAMRYRTGLAGVPTIGDSLRDLQAGVKVGCLPILVLTGKGKKTQKEGGLPDGTRIYADLAAAVDALIDEAAAPVTH